jgi:hypothetical protein
MALKLISISHAEQARRASSPRGAGRVRAARRSQDKREIAEVHGLEGSVSRLVVDSQGLPIRALCCSESTGHRIHSPEIAQGNSLRPSISDLALNGERRLRDPFRAVELPQVLEDMRQIRQSDSFRYPIPDLPVNGERLVEKPSRLVKIAGIHLQRAQIGQGHALVPSMSQFAMNRERPRERGPGGLPSSRRPIDHREIAQGDSLRSTISALPVNGQSTIESPLGLTILAEIVQGASEVRQRESLELPIPLESMKDERLLAGSPGVFESSADLFPARTKAERHSDESPGAGFPQDGERPGVRVRGEVETPRFSQESREILERETLQDSRSCAPMESQRCPEVPLCQVDQAGGVRGATGLSSSFESLRTAKKPGQLLPGRAGGVELVPERGARGRALQVLAAQSGEVRSAAGSRRVAGEFKGDGIGRMRLESGCVGDAQGRRVGRPASVRLLEDFESISVMPCPFAGQVQLIGGFAQKSVPECKARISRRRVPHNPVTNRTQSFSICAGSLKYSSSSFAPPFATSFRYSA